MSSNTNNNPAQWVVAYASVIGNGHIVNNIPCQDSCAHERINDTWGVAVVCDGAGSASHSHIGSDFVARNVAHCYREIVERCGWATEETMPTPEVWRKEALTALQLVMQRLRHFAQEQTIDFHQLACTVVSTLYSPFGLLVAHIGDGRAAYNNGKEWQAFITPFRGEEANATVFITSNIWTVEGVEQFIATHVIHSPIHAFALTSDGCEHGSFEVTVYDEATQKYSDPNRPYPRFFDPNVKGLLQLHKEQKTQAEINQLWSGFLTDGHKQFKHEIDDKTLILGVLVPEN